MKLSDKLLTFARAMEDIENGFLIDAECDEKQMEIVANVLVAAANIIKKGAEEIAAIEPNDFTAEKLEEMAAVAQAFDESGDEMLMRQASVLDDILLTLAAPKGGIYDFKLQEENRLKDLKKRYQDVKKEQDELNKISDTKKDIEKSPYVKEYRPLEHALSTRYCPNHSGVSLVRISDNVFQCALDKEIIDFATGYTTLKGDKVPGGSVEEQTKDRGAPGHTVFTSRNEIMGTDHQK
jgi:hypothetical protein